MKTTLSLLALVAMTTLSVPAFAYSANLLPAQTSSLQHATSGAVVLLARHGADDPANHHRYDDKGGNRPGKSGGKGRGGHDDGPRHT